MMDIYIALLDPHQCGNQSDEMSPAPDERCEFGQVEIILVFLLRHMTHFCRVGEGRPGSFGRSPGVV